MQLKLSFFEKIASSQEITKSPVKSKGTPNQSKKVKFWERYHAQFNIIFFPTKESFEKYQENNQKEDEKICFTCNEEECKGNAEDSVWLQCEKSNFWTTVIVSSIFVC